MKEIVEMKQRSLAEENQKTLEVLKERYYFFLVAQKEIWLLYLYFSQLIRDMEPHQGASSFLFFEMLERTVSIFCIVIALLFFIFPFLVN